MNGSVMPGHYDHPSPVYGVAFPSVPVIISIRVGL